MYRGNSRYRPLDRGSYMSAHVLLNEIGKCWAFYRFFMYSFIVFKYVNLVLWKEKIQFRENWLIFLGIWGKAELILRNLGSKGKIFSGSWWIFFFSDLGRSMHYFQGSREHRPPGGLYTDVGYNKKYLPTKLFQGTDKYVVRRIDSLPKPTIRESSKWSV